MSTYELILSAASQLPVSDRLRLIDELASSVPDDQPPQLSADWLREIECRSREIDSGAVATEDWTGRTSALDCSRSTVLTVQISFHPDATAELEASADWYSERSLAAGRDFCVAVDVALASIDADPGRFVQVDTRHQACSVQKFPYQIVFRHDKDRIHVVAVAQAMRRPGYWRDR